LKPAGNFLFRAFSLLPGAFQRGPLPVFEFLFPADAFPLFFLLGTHPCGAVCLQLSPLPLCAFGVEPLPFLAGTLLQRACQLLTGDPFLLCGLLALGGAVTLGRLLLLAPGLALLFLTGAFLSYAFLLQPDSLLLQPDSFLFLASAFFGGCAVSRRGAFPLGGAFLLLPCAFLLLPCALLSGSPLRFLPGAFIGGTFLGCITFTLELGGAFLFLPVEFFGGPFHLRGPFPLLPIGLLVWFDTLALHATCLPDAALIPNPAVPPGRALLLRFADELRFFRAIRLRVLDIRAGNRPRRGHAGQRRRIELRVLVRQVPRLTAR
jgi:hypothetical protein